MSKRAKTVSVVESEGVSSAFDSKKPFRFMGCMKEDHKQPIYAVSFCDHGEPHNRFFCSVGGNRVSVYECLADGTTEIVQVYLDDDVSTECIPSIQVHKKVLTYLFVCWLCLCV